MKLTIYKNKLRNIVLSVAILFASASVYSQSATDYFMESSYLRTSKNPALRPNQGYVVVPFLPNLYVGAQTNTLNLEHLTYSLDGERVTFMHKDVSAGQFLNDIKDDNYLNTDVSYRLLGAGFYAGEGFWSINLDVKAHVDANLPKQLFALAKTGFSQNEQTIYDLENINATGKAYVELGVGYSRPFLNNALMIGVRPKLLFGAADFDLDAKSMTIEAGPDRWRTKSNILLKASMPNIKVKTKIEDDGTEKFDGFEDFESDGLGGLGYGLGIDLGGVYDLGKAIPVLSGLKVSASVTDIGFIRWGKKNTAFLESPETEVVINPNDYTIHQDGSTSLNDVFEDVLDDINMAANLKEVESDGQTIALRSTVNIGAEYSFLNNKISAGALYSNRFGTYFNTSEFTVSGNFRPTSWFATSVSYSFMHSNFDTFGLALHLAPKRGVSFFLASDYAIPHINSDFVPTTTKALNLQLGMSIPIGAKR